MGEEQHGGLLGRLKTFIEQTLESTEAAPAPVPPSPMPPSAEPPTGATPKTRGLDRYSQSSLQLPGRARTTGQLPSSARATSELPASELAAAPPAPAPATSEAELSQRRLAMIADFIAGKAALAEMQDPTYMYRIVSDERGYQVQLLKGLQAELKDSSARAPDATEQLAVQIAQAQAIIANLFKLLKHLTGKQGKTGGTGFLGEGGPGRR